MKKIIYFILMVFSIALTGCNSDDNGVTYTKSELETFLIKECNGVSYLFEEEGMYFEFYFKKNNNGNIGEYYRKNYNNGKRKMCDFIWDVEPSGNEGNVTMSFEKGSIRLNLRMKLVEEEYFVTSTTPSGIVEIKAKTRQLWKLDFKLKDDPFKGE